MFAALLPLRNKIKPIPTNDTISNKNHNPGMFSIDELFNPLSILESDSTDDEDSSSCLCVTTCHDCETELNRLLVNTYQEDDEGIIRCKQCATAIAATTENRCRRVRFATTSAAVDGSSDENDDNLMVVVHLIPSHRDYTDEEYYGMWHHPDELLDNASRNRVEYKYEGHWKMAYEEDQFIMCSDGKLYHPVTVRLHLRQLQRQQRQQQQQKQQQQQWQHTMETHHEQNEEEVVVAKRWGSKNNNQKDVPMKKPLKKIEEVEHDDDDDDDTVSSTSVSSTSTSTSCSSSSSSSSSDNQITQPRPQSKEQNRAPTATTNMIVVPNSSTTTTTDLVVVPADAPMSPRIIACVA